MTEPRRHGPVLIELDDDTPTPRSNPADATPIEDMTSALPRPATMELVTRLAGRGASPLTWRDRWRSS